MVCEVHLLPVLLLLLPLTPSFTSAAVNLDVCTVPTLLGGGLTLTLEHKLLNDNNTLRWEHNGTVIFYRQGRRVRTGQATDVNADGYLLLRNLDFSSAGVYMGVEVNGTGARVNGWSGRVCVREGVPRPELTFVCAYRSDGLVTATLNCGVANPKDVDFSWTRQGLPVNGAPPGHTLSVSLGKDDEEFSCSVRNGVSREKRDLLNIICPPRPPPCPPPCPPPPPPTPPPPPPPALYSFRAGTVIAAMVGGIALILLLLIVTVVLCYRWQKQAKLERRTDLPMDRSYTDLCGTDGVNADYEVIHRPGVSPGPGPGPAAGPRNPPPVTNQPQR